MRTAGSASTSRGRALGDEPAAVEHVGARRQALDERHVVLAQQDGHVALGLHLLEHGGHGHGLVAVEARRRLVEEQQARLADQGPGQLDHAGRARAAATGPGRRPRRQPDQLEHRVGPGAAPRRVGSRSPGQVPPAGRRVGAGPGRPPAGARARSARRTARCAGRCGPRPGGPGGAADMPARSWPSRRTLPPSGSITPARQLNSVVLPAPLGPISPTSSLGPDLERDVDQGGDAAEALGDPEWPRAWRSSRRPRSWSPGRRPGPARRSAAGRPRSARRASRSRGGRIRRKRSKKSTVFWMLAVVWASMMPSGCLA